MSKFRIFNESKDIESNHPMIPAKYKSEMRNSVFYATALSRNPTISTSRFSSAGGPVRVR